MFMHPNSEEQTHSFTISLVSESMTSYRFGLALNRSDGKNWPTLMMMAKVDRNNVGFADGSRTLVEDWKLWMDVKRYQVHKPPIIP